MAVAHEEAQSLLSDKVAGDFADRLASERLSQKELDPIQQELTSAIGKDVICRIFAQILWGRTLQEGGLMHAQLSALCRIPCAAVITSNWDDLLERYVCSGRLGKQSRTAQGYAAVLGAQLPAEPGGAPLLKFQGDPSDPSTFVLNEEDYSTLLSDSMYIDFWRELLRTRVLLFVGASLSGGYVNDILREAWHAKCMEAREQVDGVGAHAACDKLQPQGYIILNDVAASEAQLWFREYGLVVLSYNSSATNWRGNLLYLEELASAVMAADTTQVC